MSIPDPSVFILGCERSGSTWVGNILDAHPGVEFLMEPFSLFDQLFEGFPTRYERGTGSECIAVAGKGFNSLRRAKYPLFYRPGRTSGLMILDRTLIAAHKYLCRKTRRSSAVVDRYLKLNLHTRDMPLSRLPRKNRNPSCVVVKELRLNLKVGFIKEWCPSARFLVCIRHPGAQLASILRIWKSGGLWELQDSLPALRCALAEDSSALSAYRACLPDGEVSNVALLAAWWLSSYNTLLCDLSDSGSEFILVEHEQMSLSPREGSARILEFCGLPSSSQVEQFVTWSTTGTGSKVKSPVDTHRNSARDAASAIRNIPANVLCEVERAWTRLQCHVPVDGMLRNYLGRCLKDSSSGGSG